MLKIVGRPVTGLLPLFMWEQASGGLIETWLSVLQMVRFPLSDMLFISILLCLVVVRGVVAVWTMTLSLLRSMTLVSMFLGRAGVLARFMLATWTLDALFVPTRLGVIVRTWGFVLDSIVSTCLFSADRLVRN